MALIPISPKTKFHRQFEKPRDKLFDRDLGFDNTAASNRGLVIELGRDNERNLRWK